MTRTGTLLLLTLAMVCPASAHTVVIEGGKVHLRGELVNGGSWTSALMFRAPWGSSFRA